MPLLLKIFNDLLNSSMTLCFRKGTSDFTAVKAYFPFYFVPTLRHMLLQLLSALIFSFLWRVLVRHAPQESGMC